VLLDARAGILFEDAGAVVCAAWVDSVGCSRRRCAQYSSRYVRVATSTRRRHDGLSSRSRRKTLRPGAVSQGLSAEAGLLCSRALYQVPAVSL